MGDLLNSISVGEGSEDRYWKAVNRLFYEEYVFAFLGQPRCYGKLWRSIATFQKAKIKIQENQILHFFQPNLRWIERILMIFVIAYRHDICQIFYISVFSIIWKFTRRTCIFATC